jgi:hypothetical protein
MKSAHAGDSPPLSCSSRHHPVKNLNSALDQLPLIGGGVWGHREKARYMKGVCSSYDSAFAHPAG